MRKGEGYLLLVQVEHFLIKRRIVGTINRRRIKAGMTLDNYNVVLYRNQPQGWVAEVPSIPGCYALMETREEALAELEGVFQMIAAEYGERG